MSHFSYSRRPGNSLPKTLTNNPQRPGIRLHVRPHGARSVGTQLIDGVQGRSEVSLIEGVQRGGDCAPLVMGVSGEQERSP